MTHVHRWDLVSHMDGCHWFATAAICADCGASLLERGERDLASDPWSAVWMEPVEGEDPCPRCRELMEGDVPVYITEITPRTDPEDEKLRHGLTGHEPEEPE